MPTEDAYSFRHLVLSHFGTCMCSNVETNLSWTCLVSGLLNFEHPSVLLFCFPLALMYFVCCKPTPLWFFVYRTSSPPPVYQDSTCAANFLYRYTSLISAAPWYMGGQCFYKINLFLVDYIVKKWHFCPKISKIRQYIEVIFVWNQWRLIIQITNKYIFLNVCVLKFLPLLGTFPGLS